MWHRVRVMRPRLRPHCQVTRQHYRGRRWHVVHDPTSNQFYRLSPVAHEFVSMLDGRRTVEEVWSLSLQTHGDGAPTQPEVIELLGQMYNTNLLSVDVTPETEQLLRRGRDRTKRRIQQQAIGIMYFKVRLFNPDRFLSWLEPLLRPLLNRWGFTAWALFVAWAATRVLPRWDDLSAMFHVSVAPGNWLALGAVFIVVKAIHETGHGVLCKRFGGQVPEFGAMLLVLLPAPYVDASACWAFPSKWRRMAVGAGGMIFELFVASIAAHVWLATFTPGSGGAGLTAQLAFNAMLTASVSTVLFNANPLMRFDGYYILSDLLEVPNLMQRSMRMLQHLCQRFIYRMRDSRPPTTLPAEAAVLLVYGLAASAYRVFLFFTITLYVMGKLFAVGLVLALWTAAAWFILPIGKFVHWLATSPQLSEFRRRAVATSLALLAAGLTLIGAIPFPEHRRADGVVESMARSGVFFGADGFVTAAHKGVGERVEAGEPIVTCENPELRQRLALARAELVEAQSLEQQYTATNPSAATVAREAVRFRKEVISAIQERLGRLVVRAPHAGVIVAGEQGGDPRALIGAYARQGQLVCDIVDTDRTRIASALDTELAMPLHELGSGGYTVRARFVSDPDRMFDGRSKRLIPGGQRRLPHAALGFSGGGSIATDPQDRAGLTAAASKTYLYVEDLAPADGRQGPGWLGAPGERVKLRFTLPSRPLLWQWIDRLRRMIQGRADV
jgi:putative peptide zinc metalloprotease protein